MDPQDLLLTALRASLIYFYLLLIIRLLGKRAVGSSSAFDFMVGLMLGEVVDEAIFGDVSMAKGMLAIGVIAAWHLINAYLSFRSKTVERLTESSPTVMIEHGKINKDALAKERLSEDDVMADLRLNGIEKAQLKQVKRATLEPNGQLSLILEDWAEPAQKKDFPGLTGEKEGKAREGAKQAQARDKVIKNDEKKVIKKDEKKDENPQAGRSSDE